MAFAEADRVQIRLYLGAAPLFVQSWPALENAITAVQAKAEGGVMADNSTELLIRSIVAELQDIDAKRKELREVHMVGRADEANVDAPRALLTLAIEGRALVHRLARTLGFQGALVDVFASGPSFPAGAFSPRIRPFGA